MIDYNSHSTQPTMADKVMAGAMRKRKETIPDVIAHMRMSFGNIIICIRKGGETLSTSSAGANGFKGKKKGTAFAARVTFEKAIEKACDKYRAKYKHNLARIEVRIDGPNQAGSEQAIMALKNKDIEVTQIINITGFPYNGCRKRKRRRV